MLPIVLALSDKGMVTLVPRADLIFCLCPVCLNEVNWRHKDATYLLHGACCCISYSAWPGRPDLTVYQVEAKPADMTNVQWIHRKSPLEQVPPPEYG